MFLLFKKYRRIPYTKHFFLLTNVVQIARTEQIKSTVIGLCSLITVRFGLLYTGYSTEELHQSQFGLNILFKKINTIF